MWAMAEGRGVDRDGHDAGKLIQRNGLPLDEQ
jgi:hypothetical protein